MRRVLFVIDQFLPEVGGAERQAWRLAEELLKRRCAVTVLTRRTRRDLAANERSEGIEIVRIRSIGGLWVSKVSGGLSAALWIARHGRDFDVIHCHGVNPVEWSARVANLLFATPYLVKIPSAGMSTNARVAGTTLGRSRLWIALARALDRVRRHVLRHANATVVMHRDMGDLPGHSVTIPNGIDPSAFAPPDDGATRECVRARLGIGPDSFVFIYTGRTTPEKNVRTLLKAWSDVEVAQNARLLLVTPPSGDASIPVDEVRQSDGVVVVTDPADVGPYLWASDCFVLPSHWEGMSNALLEALAAGLPVAVSDVPGNRATLFGAGVGAFFDPNSSSDLGRTLKERRGMEPAQLRLEGARGQRFVQEAYDIRAIADRYAALYDELLGDTR